MQSEATSQLRPLEHFSIGVMAEVATVMTTQPLDTIKTYRMNGMGQPAFRRLWDGGKANCLGAFVQGGVPFLINGLMATKLSDQHSLRPGLQLSAGFMTGMLSAILMAPFERIAKLQQNFQVTMRLGFQMAVQDPSGGLFKPFSAIALREALVWGTYFGARKVLCTHSEQPTLHPLLQRALVSFSLGAAAGILTTPIDKVSVWMATDISAKYTTILQTGKAIIKAQGVLGLFRGAVWRSSFMSIYMLTLGVVEDVLRPQRL